MRRVHTVVCLVILCIVGYYVFFNAEDQTTNSQKGDLENSLPKDIAENQATNTLKFNLENSVPKETIIKTSIKFLKAYVKMRRVHIVVCLVILCIVGYYVFFNAENQAANPLKGNLENSVLDKETITKSVKQDDKEQSKVNSVVKETITKSVENLSKDVKEQSKINSALKEIVIKNVDQFSKDVKAQSKIIRQNTLKKIPKIHLTVRMPLRKDILERIFCDFLRSIVLFWHRHYGDVLFILDNEDEPQTFEAKINALGLPHKFRCAYEKDFIRRGYIEAIGKKQDRPYGYLRMYYSSFIMDWYVGEDDIVGWADSDIVFSIPVTDESIFRDGKIIVKGINQFHYPHVQRWARNTQRTLGLPMVSDFMSSFPTPVYARTLRNLRNYIVHRFNTTTFEEAYIKIIDVDAYICPVCIIFSYAWHFEHDLYDWHLDLAPDTLASYNPKHMPRDNPLTEGDIRPDLHITVHMRYFNRRANALEIAICYSQIALGMTNIPHCDKYRNVFNHMLFEFQSQQTHVESWCGPGPKREFCKKIVDERYKIWVDYYRKNNLKYNTDYLKVITDFAKSKYGIKCYDVKFAPYT